MCASWFGNQWHCHWKWKALLTCYCSCWWTFNLFLFLTRMNQHKLLKIYGKICIANFYHSMTSLCISLNIYKGFSIYFITGYKFWIKIFSQKCNQFTCYFLLPNKNIKVHSIGHLLTIWPITLQLTFRYKIMGCVLPPCWNTRLHRKYLEVSIWTT